VHSVTNTSWSCGCAPLFLLLFLKVIYE
jgi:hypothetical protein